MSSSLPVPHSAQAHNADYSNSVVLFLFASLIVVALPGALAGALIATAMWRLTKPDILTKWLLAGLGVATAVALHSAVAIGWPWRPLVGQWLPSAVPALPPNLSLGVALGALVGPLVLTLFEAGQAFRRQTIQGQEWERYRTMARQRKALERHWPGPSSTQPKTSAAPGTFLLGHTDDGRPFEVGAFELAQHVFVPGTSGSGKTTTLVTLAAGAIANGYGVVIVDCKGAGLGGSARRLAAAHNVPFTIVDPKDPDSAGYDPCSGDPAAIANKLIGTFTFSGDAEIYKQVAMEVVPLICRALVASGSQVTLDAIYESLDRNALSRLGRRPGAEAYRARLEDLDESGGVGAAGYAGLQRRLGALMEGYFGDVFRKRPAVDWMEQLRHVQLTYFSLPSTAASEDVDLFARVIAQDLKQLCDERIRLLDRGEDVRPVLIVFDEFAALNEPTQIVDLLLQARGAKAPVVVATQFLPEDPSIRRPVLSAGILITHRLEAEDAEKVAAQFGTRTVPNLTAQVDYETGRSEKGSVRQVEEFIIHPNLLKSLPVGAAAVYARPSNRQDLVEIAQTT